MKKKLELYIHIPFCVRKCAYCDFLSGPADFSYRKQYVETLITEIYDMGKEYGETYEVSTVFIGGGTPSILEEEQIIKIAEAIKNSFELLEDAEITMEVNPGTVDDSKLRTMKKAGINRLSIGLQSVDDGELKMLGRIHTFAEFKETYEKARRVGFKNVNVDLISAIPGQTYESWINTLETVALLEPEHISAYSLIIEEGTPFYEKYGNNECDTKNEMPSLPDEETERMIYKATETFLHKYGYRRYEISNYAKNGFECKHNLGYWERKDYLGLGLGAASLIGHERFSNTSDYNLYIQRNKEKDIRVEKQNLTTGDEIEEFMFLGLRKTNGISVAEFEQTFHRSIWEVYEKQINKFVEERLLEIEGDRIYLTELGLDLCNSVFVDFLDPFEQTDC